MNFRFVVPEVKMKLTYSPLRYLRFIAWRTLRETVKNYLELRKRREGGTGSAEEVLVFTSEFLIRTGLNNQTEGFSRGRLARLFRLPSVQLPEDTALLAVFQEVLQSQVP